MWVPRLWTGVPVSRLLLHLRGAQADLEHLWEGGEADAQ